MYKPHNSRAGGYHEFMYLGFTAERFQVMRQFF